MLELFKFLKQIKKLAIAYSVLFFIFMPFVWADGSASRSSELANLSLEDLMNVEVTSVERQESTVGQSPAAIFVITPEMIRRSGATMIPELFRMVPGMEVARIDNNKWAISARGLNDRFQRFLLVQVDGRPVYSASFAGVYWDALDYPLEDIDRIEVIRGPGASLWGANAVNGIINIITKHTKDTQGGLITSGGGSNEQGFGAFRYGGKVKKDVTYRFYGKGFNRGKQFSESGDTNDAWSGGSVGGRADWQVDKENAVSFDIGYLGDEAGRRDRRAMISAPFAFDNLEDESSNAVHLLTHWDHKIDETSSWSLQAYWDRFIRTLEGLDLNMDWDTYDLDFQHQFVLGDRQHIIWGLDYRVVDSNLRNSNFDNGFLALVQN